MVLDNYVGLQRETIDPIHEKHFVKELPEEEAEIRAYIREASAKIVAAVRAGEEAVTL